MVCRAISLPYCSACLAFTATIRLARILALALVPTNLMPIFYWSTRRFMLKPQVLHERNNYVVDLYTYPGLLSDLDMAGGPIVAETHVDPCLQ